MRVAVLPAILLLTLSAACADERPAAGPVAPVTWTEPAKYSFVLDSRCGERALIGRFQVTVTSGAVRATGLDDAARRALMLRLADLVPSLGRLEAEAEQARSEGATVRIDRDPADAHPLRISIDPSPDAVDDESCSTIEDYTIG